MIEKTILCIDTAQMHKAMKKAVEKGVSPEVAGNKSRSRSIHTRWLCAVKCCAEPMC